MQLVGEIEDAGREMGAHHYITERPAGEGTEARHARDIMAALIRLPSTALVDLPAGADRSTAESRARALARGDEHGEAVQEVRRESREQGVQTSVCESVAGKAQGSDSARIEQRGLDRAGDGSDRGAGATHRGDHERVLSGSAIPDRVAGIDPGSRWVAVAILDASGCVAGHTFDVGRVIPLEKPRVVKRRDGSERTIDVRREVTDEDVERLLGDIAEYLAAHGVARVAVERAAHFHMGDGATGAQAAGLARAQWVGGEIAGMLRGQGYAVSTCSSAKWRARLRAKGTTWQQGLAVRLPSLPTGEHIADAAGVALTLLAPPSAPKVPRAPRAKGESRGREATAKRKAREGCTGCTGRCMLPCPRAVAANEKRRQSMRGNTSARRGW
jgi:hypothetical protein